LRVTEGFVLFS